MIGKVKALFTKAELHSSYRRIFETPDGQRVLKHLMKTCFVTSSTFVAGDQQQTTLNEGSRRVVLSILKFLGQSQDKLDKMIEEGLQDENT
jgi:hypothetical protein